MTKGFFEICLFSWHLRSFDEIFGQQRISGSNSIVERTSAPVTQRLWAKEGEVKITVTIPNQSWALIPFQATTLSPFYYAFDSFDEESFPCEFGTGRKEKSLLENSTRRLCTRCSKFCGRMVGVQWFLFHFHSEAFRSQMPASLILMYVYFWLQLAEVMSSILDGSAVVSA